MQTTTEKKIEISKEQNAYDDCILVEASKLLLNDTFMSYKPESYQEHQFKATLIEVINKGIEDFYRPAMDPSFADKKMTKIHYKMGEKPAVGKSYNWWKEYLKDSKWCFGTKNQYIAFFGVLIKKMVDDGSYPSYAWHKVCTDSEGLGSYRSPRESDDIRNTGSRGILGFFDLANTYKLLAEYEKESGFWVASSPYFERDDDGYFQYNALTKLYVSDSYRANNTTSVPWLVLKK